ncbi:MAG TPA: 5-formyltetrahydrofolate cyclo-ligase [Firmicutes bacterium]|jgi:5-formyltetrahydrofolate cyclo-ligase|nr:5-formyltetrahydrofolate cyclo-ligase [Bacillota bacterium]
MNSKESIRSLILAQRNALSESEVASRSGVIANMIKEHPFFINAKMVALYYPLGKEVDLWKLVETNKHLALPKVIGDELHFIEVTSKTLLIKSSFGIMEPVAGSYVDHDIDLLLVPTVALDNEYYRIGFGKGYYDRFLAKIRPPHVMAVIYDFQLIDDSLHQHYDVPLDGYFIG